MLCSQQVNFSTKNDFIHSIEFILNGKKIVLQEGQFNPSQSVASFIRNEPNNLTGTKQACEEGGCGACTILVSKLDPITKPSNIFQLIPV